MVLYILSIAVEQQYAVSRDAISSYVVDNES